ncbi:hypothetical protein D0469_18045 [Peribacillus saganii]|uniref:Uncharacterized protein n=1 Tax=Peribacillus saganii TaxID=2303992 RepID=A0A372LGB9_9BACI|nr:hypothetical protein D0469_18045 [Peribacillus saganii]
MQLGEEIDRMKEMKRLCVTGETRITAREHISVAAVRLGRGKGSIPYLFLFIKKLLQKKEKIK